MFVLHVFIYVQTHCQDKYELYFNTYFCIGFLDRKRLALPFDSGFMDTADAQSVAVFHAIPERQLQR